MRALTFHGFLRNYVQQLSGTNTESPGKLLHLVHDNPRLKAPTVLYAMVTLPEDKLLKLAAKEKILAEELESHFAQQINTEKILEYLQKGNVPEEYKKVYKSYLVKRDKSKQEQELKRMIRDRALQLAEEKGVSDYRVYKDLGINNGNFHAFMRKGEMSKLGLTKARQLLEYYEAG